MLHGTYTFHNMLKFLRRPHPMLIVRTMTVVETCGRHNGGTLPTRSPHPSSWSVQIPSTYIVKGASEMQFGLKKLRWGIRLDYSDGPSCFHVGP